MTDDAKPSSGLNVPDIESVHRDVGFALGFRIEGIKYSLAIATALLAFTVSFRPTLKAVQDEWMMLAAWLMLGLSIAGGLVNLHGWDRFFISYRDYDFASRKDVTKVGRGKPERKRITRYRRLATAGQWVGLFAGVLLIAIFTWLNFNNAIQGTPR